MNCSTHPGAAAAHRCDGCGRLLCSECIDEGHRLLFCRACGERALPIEAVAPVTAAELGRHRPQRRVSLGEALLYVFRGRGVYVFGSYLGVLAALALLGFVPILGSAACLVSVLFAAAVLVLVPGALFAIVRTTAAGDDELPEWPALTDVGERLGEIFDFLLVALLAALPLIGLIKLLGCAGWGPMPAHCWMTLVAGWFLAMALWVPAFGALAVYQEGWLAFRLDLHARAIHRGGGDLLLTALLATALIVLGQVLSVVLAAFPVVGLTASAAAGMYGWFTAAHLVGLFYRRNEAELAAIYGGH